MITRCKICDYPEITEERGLFFCPACTIFFTEKDYPYDEDFFVDFGKWEFNRQRQKVFDDFLNNPSISRLTAKKIRVLDIGCATGTFVEYCLTKTSWTLTGIDVSKVAIGQADKKNLAAAFIAGTIEDYADTAPIKFDLIFCSHSLEHVAKPIGFINSVRKLLHDDGLAYFELPNERTDMMFLYKNKFNLKKIHEHYRNHPYGHLFFYNQKSIKTLFKDFRTVSINFKQFPLITVGRSWKIYVTEPLKRFLFLLFPLFRKSDRIVIIVKK